MMYRIRFNQTIAPPKLNIMKVADLLEVRSKNWNELDRLCAQMERRDRRRFGPAAILRFASLYRAACADLALADAEQLPPPTVDFLHRLVGRAHNQLYRSHQFHFARWGEMLLIDVPRTVFSNGCARVAFFLFWGVFLLSGFLALSPNMWPSYVENLAGEEHIVHLEEMYDRDNFGRTPEQDLAMAGFYIFNNTGIGLQCFATMLLVVPGFYMTVFNGALLGGCFGYMLRPDAAGRENFFEFVTAHGPFELTAIVLSVGAGMQLGMSWVDTRGWTRSASIRRAGREVMPVVGAMMVLFFLAALTEGFLSPLAAPFWLKAFIADLSAALLFGYFVLLGYRAQPIVNKTVLLILFITYVIYLMAILFFDIALIFGGTDWFPLDFRVPQIAHYLGTVVINVAMVLFISLVEFSRWIGARYRLVK